MDEEPMPDAEIRSELERLQIPHGPITRSTRRTYILAIEKARRQAKSEPAYAYSRGVNTEESLDSPSVGSSRQSGRRKSGSMRKAKDEDQSEVVNLVPGLANMPSLDKKHSSGSQRRRNSVDRSSGSFERVIPILPTNEEYRKSTSLSSAPLSRSTPKKKDRMVDLNNYEESYLSKPVVNSGSLFSTPLLREYSKREDRTVNLNDFQGSFNVSEPEISVQRRFNLPNYDVSSHLYKEDRRSFLDENDVYCPPKNDLAGQINEMADSFRLAALNAWAVVKQKVGEVFQLSNVKPYHNERSQWSTYDGGESSGKYKLTEKSSRPILMFLVGIFILLAVLYVAVGNRNMVSPLCALICDAFYDTIMVLYKRMLLPLFSIFCVFMVLAAAYFYKKQEKKRADEERQQMYELAEKVTDHLKNYYRHCVQQGIKDKFLPVPHVRDHLIPISKREQMAGLWERTVQFICENESRIRTETHRVSGEEFLVWQWIQLVGPQEEDRSNVPARMNHEESVLPQQDRSDCLKIRGLFDADLNSSDKWKERVKETLLSELGTGIRILHIEGDPNASDGSVYVRMASVEEAQQACEVLQSCLFNGRPVSVKFIRPEVYFNRYPNAKFLTVPLKQNYHPISSGFRYF
uniref:LEM domain-containing protein n=1 Tax=Trichuris muris TaxID=70415 RepID=A0A5S6R0P8_TRIMR